MTFKASTSSKSKGKAKKEESSDDEASDFDMESMALFVKNFGKFMKKGYKSRKRRDNFKNKDQVRRCFRCKSKDHILVDCPYNSENKEDEKKKKKKEKKMYFKKKKKGGSYVVT